MVDGSSVTNNEDGRKDASKTYQLHIDALENLLEVHPDPNVRMHVAVLRARIETLPARLFSTWGYFERWAAAIARYGVERGLWTEAELTNEMGLAHRPPRTEFAVGDRVVVRAEREPVPWRQPHVRTPGYLHNCVGTVVARLADELDQDYAAHAHLLALASPPPTLRVYRVRFAQRDVWPRVADAAAPDDDIDAEIFEDWLATPVGGVVATEQVELGHDSDDDHHHEHEHEHDGHTHEDRWAVEQRAATSEAAPAAGERFCRALLSVAVARGIVTHAALASYAERKSARDDARARTLVARAWCDAAFRARLLDETQCAGAVRELLGIELGPTKLVVVANTPTLHHVVVCTLCSCYPSNLLGRAPQWCKHASLVWRRVF